LLKQVLGITEFPGDFGCGLSVTFKVFGGYGKLALDDFGSGFAIWAFSIFGGRVYEGTVGGSKTSFFSASLLLSQRVISLPGGTREHSGVY